MTLQAAPGKKATPRASAASPRRAKAVRRDVPTPARPLTGTSHERLGLRRPPSQGRGVATFERVLATASELLSQVGAEGLTTNLIASQSGVNISSIYKYFPNKQAILVALFERHNQQRVDATCTMLENLGTAAIWMQVLDQAFERLLQCRRETPGSVALRRAMRSSPDLADIDQRANADVAVWFARQIRALTGLGHQRALVVARIAVEAEVALLDWWESPEVDHAPAVAREIKALAKAYIGLYAPPVTRAVP